MKSNIRFLQWGSALACVMFLFSACMHQPVRRGNTGYAAYGPGAQGNQSHFNPIRKKVALLPLFNEAPFGKEDLAITATEELRKELGKLRNFIVAPEGQELFGDSKEIYAGGGMKLVQLTRKAKLSGINLVIYGRITHARVRQSTDEIGMIRKTRSYAESVVELRVFDVHANKEIFSEKMDGNINDSAHKFFLSERESTLDYRRNLLRYSVRVAARRFLPQIDQLGSKLDWTGRVAKIVGTKIYINAGRQSGIAVGDILKVITEGVEVYDPESGALLGISKGEVKGTLEVVDFFGPDGSVVILHSGGSVTEGDFVQLY